MQLRKADFVLERDAFELNWESRAIYWFHPHFYDGRRSHLVQMLPSATVVLRRNAQPELVGIFHPALPRGQVVCQQIFFDGL